MPRNPALVLASGSRYRAEMLERLGLPFRTQAADIDESPEIDERPAELVRRLALEKAKAVARDHPGSLVIGADQVAALADQVIGKPLSRERAIAQIQAQSGQEVDFLSGLALIGPKLERVDMVPTRIRFRVLSEAEIERYVERDQPLDCAGAMRSEALGITLVESITSDDPTALIGLPLVRLSDWLRAAGLHAP